MDTSEEWMCKVYRRGNIESGMKNSEWRLLRLEILSRDKYTCLRCEEKFRSGKYLSVHHLVPRSCGGSNDCTNLVTLCNPCHDYVEINDLRTIAEITGSSDNPIPVIESVVVSTDWHTWVYGGARKPDIALIRAAERQQDGH